MVCFLITVFIFLNKNLYKSLFSIFKGSSFEILHEKTTFIWCQHKIAYTSKNNYFINLILTGVYHNSQEFITEVNLPPLKKTHLNNFLADFSITAKYTNTPLKTKFNMTSWRNLLMSEFFKVTCPMF